MVVYDDFEKPGGYTMADYFKKWENRFGPGDMAVKDTRNFKDGVFSVGAVPYQTAHDSSVLDHIKYFGTSTQTFKIPRVGSIEFSADFTARRRASGRGTSFTERTARLTAIPPGNPGSRPCLTASRRRSRCT